MIWFQEFMMRFLWFSFLHGALTLLFFEFDAPVTFLFSVIFALISTYFFRSMTKRIESDEDQKKQD
ncbi:hypothetical protein [Aliicoccus persicus]|uniref:Uncharacterized protein n=1 Tax=Aliicoccus persicus TaxID=930138 RepID=A0A662Z1S6_9STAP|nr:hypothetical protein [Aliicoccus persicus]SEV86779.1 hypothetical protein SAMN05192557_0607 [Aliicoccus persicus]